MGSYSKATFGFAIAPTRLGAVIAPGVAAPVAKLYCLQEAKFGFSPCSGVALSGAHVAAHLQLQKSCVCKILIQLK